MSLSHFRPFVFLTQVFLKGIDLGNAVKVAIYA